MDKASEMLLADCIRVKFGLRGMCYMYLRYKVSLLYIYFQAYFQASFLKFQSFSVLYQTFFSIELFRSQSVRVSIVAHVHYGAWWCYHAVK